MKKLDPDRYALKKVCKRCEILQPCTEFMRIRGGGTSSTCKSCFSEIQHQAAVARAAKTVQLVLDHEAEYLERAKHHKKYPGH